MRTALLGLALSLTGLAEAADVEVLVPPSAAHPQSWLSPKIRNNPKPGSLDNPPGKPGNSLAEFVAPEVISKIVVDQYAGPPDDVRRYLTAMPTAPAQYFGPSLQLCPAAASTISKTGAALIWTSTSTVTFESGRTARLAVATVGVSNFVPFAPGPNGVPTAPPAPDNCLGFDKVPLDSLYVSYIDPDGHTWYFAVPLQRKK